VLNAVYLFFFGGGTLPAILKLPGSEMIALLYVLCRCFSKTAPRCSVCTLWL